jgi:hypothetical protein
VPQGFVRIDLRTSASQNRLCRSVRTSPGIPRWFNTHRINLLTVKVKHLQSKRRLFRWSNHLSILNIRIYYLDMLAGWPKSLSNTRVCNTPTNRIILCRTCRICPSHQWDQSKDIATRQPKRVYISSLMPEYLSTFLIDSHLSEIYSRQA